MSIKKAVKQYTEQLMALPNVTGVGLGEKQGRPVIKVFVTHKVPESNLRPEEIIPMTIGGYPTDVEELGAITALDA